jgi:hypothetical protein
MPDLTRLFRARPTKGTAATGWEVKPSSRRRLYPLPTTALLGITGERYHEREVRMTLKTAAHDAPAGLDKRACDIAETEGRKLGWFTAELLPEPDNRYDHNAVAVWSPVGHIGYLDRDHAEEFHDTFELLRKHGYEGAYVPAFGRHNEQQVVLCLDFADRCHRHLHDQFVSRPAWEALQDGDEAKAVAERFGYAGTGPLRTAVRRWARENNLPDPESHKHEPSTLHDPG